MQNTKLDTTISSNSQELFDFNAKHNGEACIESLRPEDRGTERQFWFTVAMMCVIFECSADTIRRRVGTLVNTGDIDETQNCVSLTNVQAFGYNTTTLYDLTVFNKLGMTFIDNQRAVEIRAKFNDVLVERETGGYGIRTVDDMINDPDTAIRLLTQLKIMRLQNKQLEMERDEAIRTKALIGSRREATAMNTASQKSKECEKLREQIGDSKTYKAVTAITWLPDYFNMSNRGLYGSLAANLKKIEAGMTSEFKHIDIPDSRFGKVKAYHVDVIERLHEMVQADENLMAKYRKITSV